MGIHSRVTDPRATIIFNTVNFHHKDGLIPQPVRFLRAFSSSTMMSFFPTEVALTTKRRIYEQKPKVNNSGSFLDLTEENQDDGHRGEFRSVLFGLPEPKGARL